MSRYLHTKAIYITTGAATSVSHDGHPYTNEDFSKGSIIALGKDDEWYYFNPPFDIEPFKDKSNWRKGCNKHFRDYWRILQSGANTPYGSAVINAPKEQLS